ncbi:hypothetical protein ACFE04_008284 [Oxalis oulophora]
MALMQVVLRLYPGRNIVRKEEDRLFGKKEQFGIKLLYLICPSSNTTLVVHSSYSYESSSNGNASNTGYYHSLLYYLAGLLLLCRCFRSKKQVSLTPEVP